MSIRTLNYQERPREKLKIKGPAALSNMELLQAMIGSGNKHANVTIIARRVQKVLKNYGSDTTYDQLRAISGLGPARITELMASIELGRRLLLSNELPIIDSARIAANELAFIRSKKQEHFVCLTLDGANRLINKRIITIGTLTSSMIHPREVFADAITDRAASIIVAHNHPSGSLEISDMDRAVTRRLEESGLVLGILVKHHIIVTSKAYIAVA